MNESFVEIRKTNKFLNKNPNKKAKRKKMKRTFPDFAFEVDFDRAKGNGKGAIRIESFFLFFS